MVELFDSRTNLVFEKIIKGRGRTIASLIVCVLSLMYYLEIENSNAASPNRAKYVLLPTVNFAALHLFGFLIFHQQLFSAIFQHWGGLLFPLLDIFLTMVIAYVNYYIRVTPHQYINWRLVLFMLSYATFHFLLVVNEIGGKDFRLTRGCLGAAFMLTMYMQQQKTIGAIVFVVAATLFYLKECHIEGLHKKKRRRTMSSSSSLWCDRSKIAVWMRPFGTWHEFIWHCVMNFLD